MSYKEEREDKKINTYLLEDIENFEEDYEENSKDDISINLHNSVYDIVMNLKDYIEENNLYLLDMLNYTELFDYIEEIIES
jgi:hypothetical protein